MRALAGALLAVLLAAACGPRGPGVDYYVEFLESLEVPADWELAHTSSLGSCFAVGHCPRASRYYFVSGPPVEQLIAARDIVTRAGFEIQSEFGTSCDPNYSGAYRSWACGLFSRKGDDFLVFHLHEPGRDPNNLGIAREGVSMTELRLSYWPLPEPPQPRPPGATAEPPQSRPAPRAAHYVAVADSLGIPDQWELAYERQKEPSGEVPCVISAFGDCPAVHRYYYVAGEPAPAYAAVKQLMIEAGFVITEELRPDCDGAPDSSVACQLTGTRDADSVSVYLFEPGQDVEQLGINREGFSIVRVAASHNLEFIDE